MIRFKPNKLMQGSETNLSNLLPLPTYIEGSPCTVSSGFTCFTPFRFYLSLSYNNLIFMTFQFIYNPLTCHTTVTINMYTCKTVRLTSRLYSGKIHQKRSYYSIK